MGVIKMYSQLISLVFTVAIFSLAMHKNVIARTIDPIVDTIEIKQLANAQVFASYIDELPAVLNYFTVSSKQEIIIFYQKHYGEVISQELKHKRLTLKFKHNEHNIRVVISTQNNKQQVDVLVQKR